MNTDSKENTPIQKANNQGPTTPKPATKTVPIPSIPPFKQAIKGKARDPAERRPKFKDILSKIIPSSDDDDAPAKPLVNPSLPNMVKTKPGMHKTLNTLQ